MEIERHTGRRRKVERWEGRRRPTEESDGLRGGNWKHMHWLTAGLSAAPAPLTATPFSSRQPHTTKMGDGPEMVSEPTAEVMIHRPCLTEWRWQRANGKQMQMTQRVVYYTGGISVWFVYKSLETGSDQTKQIFIVGRKIVVAQISLEPKCMLLETRSAECLLSSLRDEMTAIVSEVIG